jgi:hypothetical protein
MLHASTVPAIQKAVLAQIAKSGYQSPSISSLKLGLVGKVGPLALAGNV